MGETDKIKFNFSQTGRAWQGDEVRQKYDLSPAKIELIEGRLFWNDADRETMLALLLENVGTDKAVSLGGFSGAMAFEKSLKQYWVRDREYTLLDEKECEYFDDEEMPKVVLGLDHVYAVKPGYEWIKLAHQTAGMLCNQHYLFGISLPIRAEAMPGLKDLSQHFLDSNIHAPANLKTSNEYAAFLNDKLGLTCDRSYHKFEEAYYPLDVTPENIAKLSDLALPEDLNALLDLSNVPKFFFPMWIKWRLVILGANCD